MDQKALLHQTAAEFLAHAAVDLFPNTFLLGGRGTSRYFYYDLLFPFPFAKETLSMIEERLVRLLKAKTQVKKREMLASNAAELFASRSQNLLSEMLKQIDGLVPICEIKDFLDFCPYPFSSSWPFAPHIKLFDTQTIVRNGQSITRIIGALDEDKNALKAHLKAPSPTSLNHVRFALEEKLFFTADDNHWIWLPKGETLRQLLIQHWKTLIAKEGFKTISSGDPLCDDPDSALFCSHQDSFLKSGCNKLAEIAYFPNAAECSYDELFQTKFNFSDRLTLFSSEENFLQTCISSLHFILEMPRILGFEYQLTLGVSSMKRAKGTKHGAKKGCSKRMNGPANGPTNGHRILQTALEQSGLNYTVKHDDAADGQTNEAWKSGSEAWIQVNVPDALGRLWSGPFMSIPANAHMPTLICSMFGTMERLVGLILEHYAGILPVWLAPEQVRLILISDEAKAYADRVHRTLESEGIRSTIDEHKEGLKSRLYQAIAEKVPYAVIIGNRESQAESLVVRPLVVRPIGSQQEECMNVDALSHRIRCECSGINEENRL